MAKEGFPVGKNNLSVEGAFGGEAKIKQLKNKEKRENPSKKETKKQTPSRQVETTVGKSKKAIVYTAEGVRQSGPGRGGASHSIGYTRFGSPKMLAVETQAPKRATLKNSSLPDSSLKKKIPEYSKNFYEEMSGTIIEKKGPVAHAFQEYGLDDTEVVSKKDKKGVVKKYTQYKTTEESKELDGVSYEKVLVPEFYKEESEEEIISQDEIDFYKQQAKKEKESKKRTKDLSDKLFNEIEKGLDVPDFNIGDKILFASKNNVAEIIGKTNHNDGTRTYLLKNSSGKIQEYSEKQIKQYFRGVPEDENLPVESSSEIENEEKTEESEELTTTAIEDEEGVLEVGATEESEELIDNVENLESDLETPESKRPTVLPEVLAAQEALAESRKNFVQKEEEAIKGKNFITRNWRSLLSKMGLGKELYARDYVRGELDDADFDYIENKYNYKEALEKSAEVRLNDVYGEDEEAQAYKEKVLSRYKSLVVAHEIAIQERELLAKERAERFSEREKSLVNTFATKWSELSPATRKTIGYTATAVIAGASAGIGAVGIALGRRVLTGAVLGLGLKKQITKLGNFIENKVAIQDEVTEAKISEARSKLQQGVIGVGEFGRLYNRFLDKQSTREKQAKTLNYTSQLATTVLLGRGAGSLSTILFDTLPEASIETSDDAENPKMDPEEVLQQEEELLETVDSLQQETDTLPIVDSTLTDSSTTETLKEIPIIENKTTPEENFDTIPDSTNSIDLGENIEDQNTSEVDVSETSDTEEALETTPEAEESPEAEGSIEIDPDAVVGKGEGVTHVLLRQLESDPVLAEKLGFDEADDKRLFVAELAHKLGYLNEDYTEGVGVQAPGTAYVLSIDESGEPLVREFVEGKEVDSVGVGRHEYEYGKNTREAVSESEDTVNTEENFTKETTPENLPVEESYEESEDEVEEVEVENSYGDFERVAQRFNTPEAQGVALIEFDEATSRWKVSLEVNTANMPKPETYLQKESFSQVLNREVAGSTDYGKISRETTQLNGYLEQIRKCDAVLKYGNLDLESPQGQAFTEYVQKSIQRMETIYGKGVVRNILEVTK